MALTDQERNFLQALKAKNVPREEAAKALAKMRFKTQSPTVSRTLETVGAAQQAESSGALEGVEPYKAPEKEPSTLFGGTEKSIELQKRIGQQVKEGNMGYGEAYLQNIGTTAQSLTSAPFGVFGKVLEKPLELGEKAMQAVTSPLQNKLKDWIGEENIQSFQNYIDTLPESAKVRIENAVLSAPALGAVAGTFKPTSPTSPIGDYTGRIFEKAKTDIKSGKATEGPFGPTPESVRAMMGEGYAKLQSEISTELNQFIEGNKSFSKKANDFAKQGTDVKEVMSDPYVYRGLEVKDGVVDPTMAIDYIQQKVDLLMDAKSKTLPEVSKYTPEIPKETYRARAVAELQAEGMLPADLKASVARLDAQLAELPDTLSVEMLDGIRAQARKSARDAKGVQKPHNEYAAMENSARDMVFEATDKISGTQGEYAALNQQIKNLITTKDFLDKSIRGAKVEGGRMGKISARLLGSIAGTPGGVLGVLLGNELGAVVSDLIVNNQLGSSLKMKMIKGMVDDPALLSQIESLVNEVQSYRPPQLEAPTSEFRTQAKGEGVIELPGKSASTIEASEIQRNSRQAVQSKPTKINEKNPIDTTIPKTSKKVNKSK